jgi:alpha-acetolactate decarboxylase
MEVMTRHAARWGGSLGLALMVVGALGGACTPTRWDGDTRHWGAIREVLRFERTQGRVQLADVTTPFTVGLGALAGLKGEVLVVDGEVWVSRADGDARPEALLANEDEEATLLVLAEVPRWIEIPVEEDVFPPDLEHYVRTAAESAGLDWSRPFPFVVRGTFLFAELHVLNGKCPFAHDDLPAEQQPFRASFGSTPGIVVGFYGEGMEGLLMHAGSKVHVHGLLGGQRPIVGHLDEVGLAAGSVLQLPLR